MTWWEFPRKKTWWERRGTTHESMWRTLSSSKVKPRSMGLDRFAAKCRFSDRQSQSQSQSLSHESRDAQIAHLRSACTRFGCIWDRTMKTDDWNWNWMSTSHHTNSTVYTDLRPHIVAHEAEKVSCLSNKRSFSSSQPKFTNNAPDRFLNAQSTRFTGPYVTRTDRRSLAAPGDQHRHVLKREKR